MPRNRPSRGIALHVAFTYSGNVEAADALAAATGASAIRSDAANREALLATVRSAGPIDVFVYNAGVMVGGDPLQLDPDKVDRMIDINVVQPGPTDTDANPASGPTAETARSFMAIKNFGKTTDISDLIAFLAGTAASRITGSTHTVDGGFTA